MRRSKVFFVCISSEMTLEFQREFYSLRSNNIYSNSIVMLEKQHEVNQKAFDKVQKTCDELLRERDAIHKELKKTESK